MRKHFNHSVLQVSVGIPAYNEEANIGRLLESLLLQEFQKIRMKEIIVVASGCTDKTVDIVKSHRKKDKRIKILKQSRQLGKTAADNLFFQKAKSKILVLICADTVLKKDCLENLIAPFANPKVGLTAARMIPLNNKKTLPDYFSHLWWRLFHQVALNYFRSGEVMAFRNLVKFIPQDIGADEVYLTDEILALGYKPKYVTRAVAYNMGPRTVKDIILMRRRHACVHFKFHNFGPKVYYPKTMDNFYVFRLFLKQVNWRSFGDTILASSCVAIEGFSRILGYYDCYFKNRLYQIWPRSQSTKNLSGKKGKRQLV